MATSVFVGKSTQGVSVRRLDHHVILSVCESNAINTPLHNETACFISVEVRPHSHRLVAVLVSWHSALRGLCCQRCSMPNLRQGKVPRIVPMAFVSSQWPSRWFQWHRRTCYWRKCYWRAAATTSACCCSCFNVYNLACQVLNLRRASKALATTLHPV